MGLRPARVPTRGCSRPRAGPTCARRSSAACRPCRCTWARSRRAAWAPTSSPGIPTATPLIDEVGELVITAADAVDAGVLLGRRRRLAAAGVLLRDVSGRVAPRRLDRDHLPRDGDHLRPLGLDDQPRRGADGHQRDLPRGAGRRRGASTRWWSTCRGRAPTGGCRCSSSCATGANWTTSWSPTIRKRVREDCSPRHVPNEIRQIAEVPRTLSGKVLEVPVKRILTGTPADQAASRESLANPEALDYFVELAADGDRPSARRGSGGANRSARSRSTPRERATGARRRCRPTLLLRTSCRTLKAFTLAGGRIDPGNRPSALTQTRRDSTTMRKLSRWIPVIGGAVAGGVIALVIASGHSSTTRNVTTTVVDPGIGSRRADRLQQQRRDVASTRSTRRTAPAWSTSSSPRPRARASRCSAAAVAEERGRGRRRGLQHQGRHPHRPARGRRRDLGQGDASRTASSIRPRCSAPTPPPTSA